MTLIYRNMALVHPESKDTYIVRGLKYLRGTGVLPNQIHSYILTRLRDGLQVEREVEVIQKQIESGKLVHEVSKDEQQGYVRLKMENNFLIVEPYSNINT